jgi:transcriptional regulator with XRE-family HTH domain
MIETKLREKRLKKGWSQTKLAYLARVPNCVISDCECGRRLPWAKARRALAKALKVPEAELFGNGK